MLHIVVLKHTCAKVAINKVVFISDLKNTAGSCCESIRVVGSMARMYQKLVLTMARDFANSEFRKQLEEVLGLLEAVPGQGGGVHSGLWGEGDGEAQ